MSWCWWALVDTPPDGATASAHAVDREGASAGWLAAWDRPAKPTRVARRGDARLLDRDGAPAWISLVLAPDRNRLLFDDGAVQQARRVVLARPPMRGLTTLLRDASHFEGSITVAAEGQEDCLRDDPFARVFAQRVLRVDGGLLGATPAPAGPTIERYGSAEPWPWDRFVA